MGEQKKKGYPLGFYISCIAYSFERFAFYGSKPLLVLFLIRAVTEGGLGCEHDGIYLYCSGFRRLYL